MVISVRIFLMRLAPLLMLSLCAGFSIGLTFAPCYSSSCVNEFFPTQTRYHIALYYSALAVTTIFLYIRSHSETFRCFSGHYLFTKPIPLIGPRITYGGLLFCIWICVMTFGSIAYWYPAQHAFWTARGALIDWTGYMFRVVWTGITGHWCDIWIGLVVIPVGRNSVIARVFHIQPSTLLQAHKMIAYGLLGFSFTHGLLYYVRSALPKRLGSVCD